MNKVTSNSDNKKRKLKVIIPLIAVGLLIVIGLAFILPTFATDGTEKFTGKEAQAARWVIGDGSYNGPSASPIPNLTVTFKAKVTSVQKTNLEKQCSTAGSKGSQGTVYMVEVDRVTFFGILAPGFDEPVCVLDQP